MSIEVKYPEPHNVYAMKRMWQVCFGDTDEYINFVFEKCFKKENALVAFYDLKPVGMLFMLPVKLKTKDKEFHGYYLYAVCTKPEYRNKGIMRQLELGAEFVAKTLNLDFLCLVPATTPLFSMYEKLGYKSTFYLGHKNLMIFPDNHIDGIDVRNCSKEDFLSIRRCYLNKKDCYLDFYNPLKDYRFEEFQNAGGHILHITIEKDEYYIAGYKQNDTFIVKETTLDTNQLNRVLPLVAFEFDTTFFKVRGLKGKIDSIEPFGMFKWTSTEMNTSFIKSLNPYMNMMLD